MGATKKMYEEMFNACEGLVLRDEYGDPVNPTNWELVGFFDGKNVYKRKQTPNTPCLLYTSPSPRDS